MSVLTTDIAAPISTTKRALTVLAATSIEWYDFFLYGTAAALVFPATFFPASLPPTVALLASFSTFSVGFIARPIGAVLFGHMGDRRGRCPALALALITMGVATTSIGCLPGYSVAGVAGPVLLVALRFIQGLAIGGQWGGAVLLITEHVPEGKRGYYASFAQAGVPVGLLLANSAFLCAGLVTSPDSVKHWAWRVPFVLSIALVGLGIYVHFRTQDEFVPPGHESSRARQSPVLQALLSHPREIVLAAGTFISTTLTFYVLLTFVLAYGTSTRGLQLPYSTMLSAVLLATIFMLPATFLIGRLSDHLGKRRTVMTGAALCAVWAFTLFPLLNTRSFPLIVLTMFLGNTFSNMIYVPAAALVTALFEKSVRCSASSLSYQLGSILGGGLAPVVATALYAEFHSGFGVMAYISVASLVSLACVALIDEHRGT